MTVETDEICAAIRDIFDDTRSIAEPAGALGVAFAANVFTLFVFYEAITLSTYPLVTHNGTDEAKAGGRTYLGILLGTSIGLFLLAIIISWLVAGTLDFQEGGILAGKLDPAWAGLLYALFLFGIGKAALMPFHRWLPAAMVAPTPVSALLHAVAVVKAGVFTLFKVTSQTFGSAYILSNDVTGVLVWAAAATILLASLVAMTNDNLKARLAYSTVSQLGFMMLLFGMGAYDLAQAGVIVLIAHGAFKAALFMVVGIVDHQEGTRDVRELGRLGPGWWPVVAVSVAAAASMAGARHLQPRAAPSARVAPLVAAVAPCPLRARFPG